MFVNLLASTIFSEFLDRVGAGGPRQTIHGNVLLPARSFTLLLSRKTLMHTCRRIPSTRTVHVMVCNITQPSEVMAKVLHRSTWQSPTGRRTCIPMLPTWSKRSYRETSTMARRLHNSCWEKYLAKWSSKRCVLHVFDCSSSLMSIDGFC